MRPVAGKNRSLSGILSARREIFMRNFSALMICTDNKDHPLGPDFPARYDPQRQLFDFCPTGDGTTLLKVCGR